MKWLWQDVVNKMYKPEDKELGIFLQQDGYMDKEQMLVKDLQRMICHLIKSGAGIGFFVPVL